MVSVFQNAYVTQPTSTADEKLYATVFIFYKAKHSGLPLFRPTNIYISNNIC